MKHDDDLPTLPATAAVQQLVPESSGAIQIKPETRVLCIHRGRRLTEHGQPIPINPRLDPNDPKTACVGDYTDTFDSKHYVIRPGFFEVEYAAAVHFRNRAVVPGSRNPETAFQASFIAIIGLVQQTATGMKVLKAVDDPPQWEPFTDEECAQYEVAFEALDRGSMVNPIEPDVQLANTNNTLGGVKNVGSRVKGGNTSARSTRGRKPDIEATDEALLTPIPPEENEAVRATRRDSAEAAAEGHKVR